MKDTRGIISFGGKLGVLRFDCHTLITQMTCTVVLINLRVHPNKKNTALPWDVFQVALHLGVKYNQASGSLSP